MFNLGGSVFDRVRAVLSVDLRSPRAIPACVNCQFLFLYRRFLVFFFLSYSNTRLFPGPPSRHVLVRRVEVCRAFTFQPFSLTA